MFFGGLIMAIAVEHSGLHNRVALRIIMMVGTSQARLMLGFMITTMFLSMWISNTATTAMMLPIVDAVAEAINSRATELSNLNPGALGSYRQVGADEAGRAVYRKDDLYLHYVNDVAHKFEAWVFSGSSDDLMGEIVNEDNNECADATGATWEVLQVQ